MTCGGHFFRKKWDSKHGGEGWDSSLKKAIDEDGNWTKIDQCSELVAGFVQWDSQKLSRKK